MRCAIIFFSGTGNTEFVVKQFKRSLEEKRFQCSLVDIAKKKNFQDDYDFLVFGFPVHGGGYPDIFMGWIEANVKEGRNRDVIIFSTQVENNSSAGENLCCVLKERGFNIKIQSSIEMPNNYYFSDLEKPSGENIACYKEKAKEKVENLVEVFIKGEAKIEDTSNTITTAGKTSERLFPIPFKEWAAENLSVDMDKCVRCRKCLKNCPAQNIGLQDKFVFKDKCTNCQKCIHSCPVNAFLFRGEKIEQYKI